MAETSDRRPPADLGEAVRYFSDVEVANEYVASLRWPDGRVCPHCGSREDSYISTPRLWKCKSCKRQFSVKCRNGLRGLDARPRQVAAGGLGGGEPADGRELGARSRVPSG